MSRNRGRRASPSKAGGSFEIRVLGPADTATMGSMLHLFGAAFGDAPTYVGQPPAAAYLERLLGSETFIALATTKESAVVGGLAAYLLPKFEQERSEIYIYALAVAEAHRRQGIATALIDALRRVASRRSAGLTSSSCRPTVRTGRPSRCTPSSDSERTSCT